MALKAAEFRSMAALYRAGMTWPEIVESTGPRDGRMTAARDALARGESLATALQPHVDPVDRALLLAGEQSGTLEQTLAQIAEAHEEKARLARQRQVALAYPVFLACVGALLLAVPDWIQGRFFAGLTWSFAILAPIGAYVFLARRAVAPVTDTSNELVAPKPPSKNPLFRNRVEESDARAFTVLAACEQAGVPLNHTLELAIAAGAGGRAAVDMYTARTRVREGLDLAGAWTTIPTQFADRLSIAERAGETAQAARYIASELEMNVDTRRKKTTAILPAVMILFIGGVIAVRLIGFYSGFYSQLGR